MRPNVVQLVQDEDEGSARGASPGQIINAGKGMSIVHPPANDVKPEDQIKRRGRPPLKKRAEPRRNIPGNRAFWHSGDYVVLRRVELPGVEEVSFDRALRYELAVNFDRYSVERGRGAEAEYISQVQIPHDYLGHVGKLLSGTQFGIGTALHAGLMFTVHVVQGDRYVEALARERERFRAIPITPSGRQKILEDSIDAYIKSDVAIQFESGAKQPRQIPVCKYVKDRMTDVEAKTGTSMARLVNVHLSLYLAHQEEIPRELRMAYLAKFREWQFRLEEKRATLKAKNDYFLAFLNGEQAGEIECDIEYESLGEN